MESEHQRGAETGPIPRLCRSRSRTWAAETLPNEAAHEAMKQRVYVSAAADFNRSQEAGFWWFLNELRPATVQVSADARIAVRGSQFGKPHRRTSLRAASVLGGACFHHHGSADARARDWRHHGHLHARPRGHASVAARQRPFAPLPHRRRRLVLRAGRAAGSLGNVLVSALRAAEGRAAGVRRDRGLSGRRPARQRQTAGHGVDVQAAAVRVRDRQLFLDPWHQCVRRPCVHSRGRHAGGGARRRD